MEHDTFTQSAASRLARKINRYWAAQSLSANARAVPDDALWSPERGEVWVVRSDMQNGWPVAKAKLPVELAIAA